MESFAPAEHQPLSRPEYFLGEFYPEVKQLQREYARVLLQHPPLDTYTRVEAELIRLDLHRKARELEEISPEELVTAEQHTVHALSQLLARILQPLQSQAKDPIQFRIECDNLLTAAAVIEDRAAGGGQFSLAVLEQVHHRLQNFIPYLEQQGVADAFYQVELPEDELDALLAEDESISTPPPLPETAPISEQKREHPRDPLAEAPALFETLEEGLPPRKEEAERSIRFGQPPEVFFIGKIESENKEVYGKLFITQHNTLKKNGNLELVDLPFAPLELPDLTASPRQQKEADITLPLATHTEADSIDLPLPLGYEIVAIDPAIKVERTTLGAYRLFSVPSTHTEIRYRIAPSQITPLPQEDLDQLTESFPAPESRHLHTYTRLADSLARTAPTTLKKVELIAGAIRSLDPLYSYDAHLGAIYQTCGEDAYLAYEALQMGHCDSFSAHLANRLRANGIPAMVISGLTPNQSNEAFGGNCGHSQVLFFDEQGIPHIFEATSLASKDTTLDPALIDQEEFRKLLSDIPTLSQAQLFEQLKRFGQRIRPKEPNPELVQAQHQSLPSFSQVGEYPSLERNNENGQFFKGLLFIMEVLEHEHEPVSWEQFNHYAMEYHRLDLYDIRKWVQEHFNQDNPAPDEFRAAIGVLAEFDGLREHLVGLAEQLLQDPSTPPEDFEACAQLILHNSFDRLGYYGDRGRIFYGIDALQLLETSYFLNLPSRRLGEIFDRSLDHLGRFDHESWEKKFNDNEYSDEWIEQWNNQLNKLTELSEAALAKATATGEKLHLHPFETREQHTGDASRHIYELGQKPRTSLEPRLVPLFNNLLEASDNKDEIICDLILPLDKSTYSPKVLEKLFFLLGSNHIYAEGLDEEGKALPHLEQALKEYIHTRWLPRHIHSQGFDAHAIDAVTALGVSLENIIDQPAIESIILTEIADNPPILPLPWKGTSIYPDIDYPLTHLVLQHSEGAPGLGPLKTLHHLSLALGTSMISPKIREAWGNPSEMEYFANFANRFDISWIDDYHVDYKPDLYLHNRTYNSEVPHTKIPLTLPDEIFYPLIHSDPTLKAINEAARRPETPTEDEALWHHAYHYYPQLAQDVETRLEQFPGLAFRVHQLAYQEAISKGLPPNERYPLIGPILNFVDVENVSGNPKVAARWESVIELSAELERLTPPAEGATFLEFEKQVDHLITGKANADLTSFYSDLKDRQLDLLQIYITLVFLGKALGNAIEAPPPSHAFMGSNVPRQLYLELEGIFYHNGFEANSYHNTNPFLDMSRTPAAKVLSQQIGSQLFSNEKDSIKEFDTEAHLLKIRAHTLERIDGGQMNFARYLSEILGQKARINSPGGELLDIRQYTPGDDVKNMDWNAYARTEVLHTKRMNEQMINPIHLVVDMEWLADGATLEMPPKNVEKIFTLIYQAVKERIDISLHFFLRGEELFHFESREGKEKLKEKSARGKQEPIRDVNNLFKRLKGASEIGLFNDLWSNCVGLQKLHEREKQNGLEYPPHSLMADPEKLSWIKPNTTIIEFIHPANINPSAAHTDALRMIGYHIQVARTRTGVGYEGLDKVRKEQSARKW